MPYGRGGVNEKRLDTKGEEVNWSLEQYVRHVSYLSNPMFHRPLFVLKMFNVQLRAKILTNASRQISHNQKILSLRDNVTLAALNQGGKAFISGHHVENQHCYQLFKSIQAINKALPHSDGAAARARQHMEALQHKFGLGGMFLTVTPDDENSFFVTLHAQVDAIGKPIDVTNLSNEELKIRSKMRCATRIKYPGITALAFETFLDVVLNCVIGWNTMENVPHEKPGLFGTPLAYGGAVEEQGRSTLHLHIIVWLEGWETHLENVTSPNQQVQQEARRQMCKIVDNSITTSVIDFGEVNVKQSVCKVFDHDNCDVSHKRDRDVPVLVSRQQLRNLRHRHCKAVDLSLFTCPHCEKKWTNEDMMLNFLTKHTKKQKLTHFPDNQHILSSECYEFTKPHNDETVCMATVNARCIAHRSCHVSSCFKKIKRNIITMKISMKKLDVLLKKHLMLHSQCIHAN